MVIPVVMDCIMNNNEAKEEKKKVKICFYNMNFSITILEHVHMLSVVPKIHGFLLNL